MIFFTFFNIIVNCQNCIIGLGNNTHPFQCILTSKKVIRSSFAGRNHFFQRENKFYIFFHHKWRKKEKKGNKITKNINKQGVCQLLGATFYCWLTTKRWLTPEENVFLFAPKTWQTPFNACFFIVIFCIFSSFFRM